MTIRNKLWFSHIQAPRLVQHLSGHVPFWYHVLMYSRVLMMKFGYLTSCNFGLTLHIYCYTAMQKEIY